MNVWSRREDGSRSKRNSWKDRGSWRGRGRKRDAKRSRGERQADEDKTKCLLSNINACFFTKPNCFHSHLSQISRPPSESWSGSGSWNGSVSVGRSF